MPTKPTFVFILASMVFTSGCIGDIFADEPADEFIGCSEGEVPDVEEEFSECTIDDNITNNSTSGENNTDNVTDNVSVDGDDNSTNSNNTTTENNSNNATSDNGTIDGNNSNGTNNQPIYQSGVNEGELIYNFNATIHYYQDVGWSEFELHSLFNSSWNYSNNNSTNSSDKWTVVVFLSTDCGHCWNAAEELSTWSTNYADDVQFLAMAVNFSSNNNFNATPDEVIAFQEQSAYIGCVGGGSDCADRPGSPHDFGYVDDRNQTQMHAWGVGGTPTFFIIQPNGIVAWNQSQNNGEENIEQALERLFG